MAALAARAGVEGAALNVRINLGGIADADFRARASEAVSALEADARRLCEAVLARVAATIELTPATSGRRSPPSPRLR